MKTLATLLLLAGAAFTTHAAAQQLADPMQPPGTAPAAIAAAPRAGLQTVLISGSRRLALIDGKRVSVGESARGAEVVEIRSTEVVLRRGRRTEVLKLLPAGVKQVRAPRRGAEPIREARAHTQKEMRP
jgi:MSHA biogenesis protein MshK